MAKCSKPLGSGYHVGVGRRRNGRFCDIGRSGCHHDSKLAHAIRRSLRRTAKGRFCG